MLDASSTETLNYEDYALLQGERFKPKRTFYNDDFTVEIINDAPKQKTESYDTQIPVIRRGNSLKIQYISKGNNEVSFEHVSLFLQTKAKGTYTDIQLTPEHPRQLFFSYSVASGSPNTFVVTLDTDNESSIGLYHVSLKRGEIFVGEPLLFYIIFNPLNMGDSVYLNDDNMLREYLLEQRIKVYCGSRAFNFGKSYQLDQFTLTCTFVCGYFLSKLSLTDRADPLLVSRAFTARVNGNDDYGLIYGNWTGKPGGTHHSDWINAFDIYLDYLKNGRPVRWGQCFVYSMLITSMCRNIGIPCRSVSGFDVGHDHNKDGIISMFFDNKSLSILPESETLWNFHAWNNAFIKRHDYFIDEKEAYPFKSEWQHIDGTPGHRSEGIFQCGPYPVELFRRSLFSKQIPYDAESVYYSINYILKYIFISDDKPVREQTAEKSCSLILTTNLQKNKLDITNEYKSNANPDKKEKADDIKIELSVPDSINIDDPMSYQLRLSDASNTTSTLLAISLDLVDISGKRLLDEPLLSTNYVYKDVAYNMGGTLDPIELSKIVDLSIALLEWNVRCYNNSKNALVNVTKTTIILPCFMATFEEENYNIKRGVNHFTLRVTNKLNVDSGDCRVVLHIKGTRNSYRTITTFNAQSEKKVSVDVTIDTPGYIVLIVYIRCGYFHGKVAKKTFLVE